MSRLIYLILTLSFCAVTAQGQKQPAKNSASQGQAPARPTQTVGSSATAATPPFLPATSPQLPAVQIPEQSSEIRRDPFRLPQYLINKFKFVPTIEAARIDDAVDPIKRWPLNTYGLIGIIWDVKNPKALIMDQQRKVHMVRVRDKIGNAGGVITSIQEGSIVVIQDKIPEVMRLKK